MIEKNLIINGREFNYKGIFRTDEIFSTINRALEEKDYQKREKKTEELVTESGRKVFVELRPFKEVSNYIHLMIKIKVYLENVTETTELIEEEKKHFQKGDVKIVFDSWILSDYENRWGMQPWTYFFKSFVNKFIYNLPTESGFKSELVQDTVFIYAKIKKLFHSYKGEVGKTISEDLIKKEVEAEINAEIEKSHKQKPEEIY